MKQIIMTVRAFFVIGCLILIPLLAACGGDLSGIAKKLPGIWSRIQAVIQSEISGEEFALDDSHDHNQGTQELAAMDAGRSGGLPPSFDIGNQVPDFDAPVSPENFLPPAGESISVSTAGDSVGSGPGQIAQQELAVIEQAESRLRQLGAVSYRLETWGLDSENYRFDCKMSVDGSDGYVRHFEATRPSPDDAILAVLAEVETWRRTPE